VDFATGGKEERFGSAAVSLISYYTRLGNTREEACPFGRERDGFDQMKGWRACSYRKDAGLNPFIGDQRGADRAGMHGGERRRSSIARLLSSQGLRLKGGMSYHN